MDLQKLIDTGVTNTKDISSRTSIGLRTIQNYVSGKQPIPEPIQKLLRYEFAEFLPEEERLKAKIGGSIKSGISPEIKELLEKNAILEEQEKEISHLKEQNSLLKRTVELLEDQVQLYKEKVNLKGSEKPA